VRIGDAGERGDGCCVRLPRGRTAFCCLGCINGRVCGSVDDRAVVAPATCGDEIGRGDIELSTGDVLDVCGIAETCAQREAELSTGADDECLSRRDRRYRSQTRVRLVLLGDLHLAEWNRPLDRSSLIGEVQE